MMINIKHLKHITILSFILLIFGCSNDSEVESPNSTSTPEAAILEVPNNNEICLTGKSLNATQSTVTFIWQAAKYATTYDLIIKNLKSMQTSTYTSNSTFKEVTLLKESPILGGWFLNLIIHLNQNRVPYGNFIWQMMEFQFTRLSQQRSYIQLQDIRLMHGMAIYTWNGRQLM